MKHDNCEILIFRGQWIRITTSTVHTVFRVWRFEILWDRYINYVGTYSICRVLSYNYNYLLTASVVRVLKVS